MDCKYIKIALGNLFLESAGKVIEIEVAMSVTLTLHYETVTVELRLHVAELINVTAILFTQNKSANS